MNADAKRRLNADFEATFRAKAFRLVYPVHCLIFGSLNALLVIGLFDNSFNAISKVLLPPAIVEGLLRIVLHHATRFRDDHQLAQRIGGQAMLIMTTGSWLAYYCICQQQRDQPAAGELISTLVPMMMVIYPVMLTLFFLTPTQQAFTTAVSVAAIASAPRWSSLRDKPSFEGEAAAHILALGLGIFIAQPTESLLRSFALSFLEVGQEHGASRSGLAAAAPTPEAAADPHPSCDSHAATDASASDLSVVGAIEADMSLLAANKARADAAPASSSPPPSKAVPPTSTVPSSSITSVFESLSLASEYELDWERVRVLGAGHFGKAVLLRHRRRQDYAVVKQMWAGPSGRQDVTRLKREVSALISLKHRQHIIGYHTCFLRGEQLCIVTDFAAGGTLHDQISHAKSLRRLRDPSSTWTFPAARLLQWTSQLTSALFCIHSERIMHRDVKPSNILLTSRLDILLGDFGLSRRTSSDTGDEYEDEPFEDDANDDALTMTHGCGTPFYMSPEQMSSHSYSYPADLWALGCVLFELITLARAFDTPSFPALYKAVIDGRSDSVRVSEHAALLGASGASDPLLPPSLIAMPTFDALLHHDPAARMTLPEVAAALWPHLPPASRGLLQPLLDVSDGSKSPDEQQSPISTLRRRQGSAAPTSKQLGPFIEAASIAGTPLSTPLSAPPSTPPSTPLAEDEENPGVATDNVSSKCSSSSASAAGCAAVVGMASQSNGSSMGTGGGVFCYED